MLIKNQLVKIRKKIPEINLSQITFCKNDYFLNVLRKLIIAQRSSSSVIFFS